MPTRASSELHLRFEMELSKMPTHVSLCTQNLQMFQAEPQSKYHLHVVVSHQPCLGALIRQAHGISGLRCCILHRHPPCKTSISTTTFVARALRCSSSKLSPPPRHAAPKPRWGIPTKHLMDVAPRPPETALGPFRSISSRMWFDPPLAFMDATARSFHEPQPIHLLCLPPVSAPGSIFTCPVTSTVAHEIPITSSERHCFH